MSCKNCKPKEIKPVNQCCVDPLEYYIDWVVKNTNQGKDLFELSVFYQTGFVTSNCDFCCPTCNNMYHLGSIDSFSSFAEYTGVAFDVEPLPGRLNIISSDVLEKCCSNYYGSAEGMASYNEIINPFYSFTAKTCCNGFNECISELNDYITSLNTPLLAGNYLFDSIAQGLVEYSTLNPDGTSHICKLIEILKKYPNQLAAFLFKLIVQSGFVTYCNPKGEIFMGSTSAFQTYSYIGVAV
jgi:hypothetical protein